MIPFAIVSPSPYYDKSAHFKKDCTQMLTENRLVRLQPYVFQNAQSDFLFCKFSITIRILIIRLKHRLDVIVQS